MDMSTVAGSRCSTHSIDRMESTMYAKPSLAICSNPHATTQIILIQRATDTEIDWTAYVQQVTQYIAGERDYTKIYGGTGPLVYPAAHVYIYQMLYRFTDRGMDIPFAQIIFGILYLMTLAVVMACYRNAKVRFTANHQGFGSYSC
jgi:hypothetical protein